jgi:hypothetical protein
MIEWLAAMYRDMHYLAPEEAERRALADFRRDRDGALDMASRFAAMVEAMTGEKDPRRIGNWRASDER